jgi:hypothetical protein
LDGAAPDLVVLEDTFFAPPRRAAAARIAAAVRAAWPQCELVACVWHLVSHGEHEGLRRGGARGLAGDPARLGDLQATQEVERALEATLATAAGLGARRLLLRTGTGVTPGALGSASVRRVCGQLRKAGVSVLWEPAGLWEAHTAAACAQSAACDLLWSALDGNRPLSLPPGTWRRYDGSGRTKQLTPAATDALLEGDEGAPLIFGGPHALRNLRQFRAAHG